ncbi:TetR/AcrR family transcriptional regulator [Kitasatospora sp. MAP5-34]|uniref:TetR/AcrR family transcriptional regulator n=1 Tax=Kitasatospora sp. MAP5-34 TaxID=3035102 RepID=UPI00247444F4|nr:TetR/AcrR family transcriptional regulator [Kitasatospora sp. MAP5-34]MDH6575422.1 AcrR family transcriptional regulator [Kitasatospora sp. MAP5-34]
MTPDRPAEPAARRRDASRSRELLLRAAVELFTERGFDRTTTREIGERAGVDPTLIARYYGGKTQLYIAAMNAEFGADPPADLLDEDRLRTLLDGVLRRGPGPAFRVTVQPYDDPVVQEAARTQLHSRLVGPLREHFTRVGLDRPQLRAEVAVAAFVGVMLGRGSGAFDRLGEADPDELLVLVRDLLGGTLPRG